MILNDSEMFAPGPKFSVSSAIGASGRTVRWGELKSEIRHQGSRGQD